MRYGCRVHMMHGHGDHEHFDNEKVKNTKRTRDYKRF